jgi:hypothetical protein
LPILLQQEPLQPMLRWLLLKLLTLLHWLHLWLQQ